MLPDPYLAYFMDIVVLRPTRTSFLTNAIELKQEHNFTMFGKTSPFAQRWFKKLYAL